MQDSPDTLTQTLGKQCRENVFSSRHEISICWKTEHNTYYTSPYSFKACAVEEQRVAGIEHVVVHTMGSFFYFVLFMSRKQALLALPAQNKGSSWIILLGSYITADEGWKIQTKVDHSLVYIYLHGNTAFIQRQVSMFYYLQLAAFAFSFCLNSKDPCWLNNYMTDWKRSKLESEMDVWNFINPAALWSFSEAGHQSHQRLVLVFF